MRIAEAVFGPGKDEPGRRLLGHQNAGEASGHVDRAEDAYIDDPSIVFRDQ
jgi:hypothetical protein